MSRPPQAAHAKAHTCAPSDALPAALPGTISGMLSGTRTNTQALTHSNAQSATQSQTPTRGLTAYQAEISVDICGRCWRLRRAADLESLWDAMTDDPHNFDDERLPYWTELWPSSVALARWLTQQAGDIAGRHCLDLGCGLGLTALVGSALGAHVTAVDYEEDALRFAALNARLNDAPKALWTLMDWRRPAVARGCMERIWGGDIMYETRFVQPVLRFLDHALTPDGLAWVAEPGRGVYDAFLHALRSVGLEGRRVFTSPVEPIYAQPVPVTVQVWELRRTSRG